MECKTFTSYEETKEFAEKVHGVIDILGEYDDSDLSNVTWIVFYEPKGE